ncbi:HAD family hydrolase [Streptomyces cinerochromogenes]|uniref:HAD family hydrolase n=1 Tax=Streptomyces cinerochromogenes TaxID=66422 RepID=A0ABW7B4X6_9ACTN
MIRFIALDLDGTLIDACDQPYEGVIAGLQTLRQRGVVPVLVSGRTARSFRNLDHLDDLFASLDDEVLLSEGNVRVSRNTDLFESLLTCPPEVLRKLAGAPDIDLIAEWSGEFYATTRRAAVQFAMAYRLPRAQITVAGQAMAEDAPRTTAVTVFRSHVPVRDLVAGLRCDVVTIGPFAAEVVRPLGTSKAVALARQLRRRFGEPDLSRTLAIGDGAADATMLAACAVGVAPRHADPKAVEAAVSHLQDDLASFLYDFRPEGW